MPALILIAGLLGLIAGLGRLTRDDGQMLMVIIMGAGLLGAAALTSLPIDEWLTELDLRYHVCRGHDCLTIGGRTLDLLETQIAQEAHHAQRPE